MDDVPDPHKLLSNAPNASNQTCEPSHQRLFNINIIKELISFHLIVFLIWLTHWGKHVTATACPAESNVINLFIVSYQLRFDVSCDLGAS